MTTPEVTPAHDVAATLAVRLPDLVVGTTLRVGDKVFPQTPSSTSRMVGVRNTTGTDFVAFHGVDDGRGEETAYVEIGIREDTNDPRGVEGLAARIADKMEILPPDGYFDCKVVGGGWQRLGPSPEGHPTATVNLRLKRDTRWLPMFWGQGDEPDDYDQAFIESLGGTDPKTRRRFTFFPITVDAGKRLFVSLPARYGVPQVRNAATKAAIPGAIVAAAVSLTLDHGPETFAVWMSTLTSFGSIGVDVL